MKQDWKIDQFLVELHKIPEVDELTFASIAEKFIATPYDKYNESFVSIIFKAYDQITTERDVLFGGILRKTSDNTEKIMWLKHLMEHKNLMKYTLIAHNKHISPRLKIYLNDPYNIWVCMSFLETILDMMMYGDMSKENVEMTTFFIQQEISENPFPLLISLISIKIGNPDSKQQSFIRDAVWSLLQNSFAFSEFFKEVLRPKHSDFNDYIDIKPLVMEGLVEVTNDVISSTNHKKQLYKRIITFLVTVNVINDFLKVTTHYPLMFNILSDGHIRDLITLKDFLEFRIQADPDNQFISRLLQYIKTDFIDHLRNLNCESSSELNKNTPTPNTTNKTNIKAIKFANTIISTLLQTQIKLSSQHLKITTELVEAISCFTSHRKTEESTTHTNSSSPEMDNSTPDNEEALAENVIAPDKYYVFLESNIFIHKTTTDLNDAIASTVEKLVELMKSEFQEDKDFVNSIVARCMDRNFADDLAYDQLYAVAKLLLAFENKKWITLKSLMEYCYELFAHQAQLSYAMVDLILYAIKERLHKHKDICAKLTSCVYFGELTPLLTVYLEFAAAGEAASLDITAYDPVPKLYQTPECIKAIAEKSFGYSPSPSEMNEFSCVDIGRIIIYLNDCNMKSQLLIAERTRVEELSNDMKNDVRFILNSTTMTNIQQKSQELANRVQFHHYAALSHFLVSAISSMSVNVDVVSNIWLRLELALFYPTFVSDFCYLVKKSFFHCYDRTDNIQSFYLFGNILGEITLNRSVPITDNNIDLKNLLIEAYFKGTTLHHALVFVSRTLIRGKQSQFFRTYNSYVLQLLSLLKEIYVRLTTAKQSQLPLEIRQTFEELGLDIREVRPSTYLDHPAYIMILPLTFQWTDMEALQLLHQYVHLTGFNHVVTPSVYQSIKYRDIEHVDVSKMLAFFNISFNSAAPRALSAKVAIHYAIERTYNEYARSVSERVNRGCLSLCETLILKDFPHDKYDDTMRRSLIDMARSIATSYSYTTLHGNLYSNLYKSFRQNVHEILISTSHQNTTTTANNPTPYDVAECSNSLAADNIDLLINLIQKFCGEKLLAELVKRISVVLETRTTFAPVEKSMHLAAYGDTQKRLPAKLKVNFTSMSAQHKAFYAKFVNYQPGFMPDISTMDHLLESVVTINNDRREQLEIICMNLEQLIDQLKTSVNPPTDEHLTVELTTLKEMIKYLMESRLGRVIVAIIKHLIMTNFYLFGICLSSQVAIPLRVIVYFREILDVFRYWEGIGPYRLAKFVTRVVMEVPQALQFSNETVFHLVRSYLIIVSDYDIFLAKCIDNAKNGSALKFAMLFCKTFLITEKQYNITNDHLKLTLSTLQYLTTVKNDTTILNLEEHLKPPFSFPTKTMDPSIIFPGIDMQRLPNQLSAIKTVMERDQCLENLFITWLTHYYDDPIKLLDPNYISAVRKAFEVAGFKPNTEYWKEFIKCTLKYGFKECLKEDADTKFVCRLCDSMAGFCSLLVKSLYEFSNIGNVAAITHLFIEIGNCLMYIIDYCSDVTKISIVRRFLTNFCLELRRPFLNDEGEIVKDSTASKVTTSESVSTPTNEIKSASMHGLLQLMYSFASLLHGIRPTRFPKFAAHWQKVVINSNVIPTLITGGTDKSGWIICNNIIVDALLFLGAIIRQGVLASHRVRYFEESLSLFHSLKEDFPEVISRYSLMYVELLPINAIQMRNTFLCASPISTDLMPNPFKHRLQTTTTELELVTPEIVYDPLTCLEPKTFYDQLLKYFINGEDDKVLDVMFELITKNSHSSNAKEFSLNIVLLNSIIFLCGYFGARNQTSSIVGTTCAPITVESVQKGVPFYIIMYLLSAFDANGQYTIIGAMANHLRFPNAYTHFFKCVFISVATCLCEADENEPDNDDTVLQLIVRTLTERLLPKPPHPWGIIATLAELLIEPNIDLISKSFVTENKDIFALLNGIREKALE